MTPLLSVTSSGTGVGTIVASIGAISCGATCSSTYAYGTVVTLTAVPATSSLFEGWSGPCSGTGSCVVTVDEAKTVGATFTIRTYPLVVVKSGSGSGTVTVTAAAGEINCGETCSATLTHGTRRTLMATPAAGSLFVGWTGDCAGRTFPSCIVTMNGPKSVGVEFAPSHYPLTVTRSGNGSGTITASVGAINCGMTCGATYAPGASVTLTATPAANMSFTGWTGACSGTGPCVVTMDTAKSVNADFTLITHVVTINVVGGGSGKIGASSGTFGVSGTLLDCEGSCSITYAAGLSVFLSGEPAPGSRFAGWSGPCSGTGNCNLTIDGSKTVTATFQVQEYPLAATRSGPGMITSLPAGIDCGGDCAENVPHGSRITLIATPHAHATFVRWTDACFGTIGPVCELEMPASATSVGAVFDWETYDVTITKTGTGVGTITADRGDINCGAVCRDSYARNDDITLTATPAPGSAFVGWSGPCTGAGTCLVPMTQAWAVEARFVPETQTLSVARTGTGTGVVTADVGGIDCGAQCSGSYAFGSSVTLTATADTGSSFVGWSRACSAETGSTCTLSIAEAPAVTARFDQIGHVVMVTRTGTGSGAVSGFGVDCGVNCGASYAHGSVVTFTASPTIGSSFAGWSGACLGTGSCVVTVDGAKLVSASFSLNTYAVSVSKTGTGSGVVTGAGIDCGSTCSINADHGSSVTLTATASADSSFAGWSGPCSGTGSCTVSVASALSVVAQFDRGPHLVSVSKAGLGTGTVLANIGGIDCGDDCSESYAHGTSLVMVAVPGDGSTFAGWSGSCSGTSNCPLTIDGAKSVTATFGLANRVLAVTLDGPGKVSSSPAGIDCGGDCSEVLPHGTSVTLTATAIPGGSFVGWSGACEGNTTPVCTIAVTGAPTLANAIFAWNRYELTVVRTGAGAGRVAADWGEVDCGALCSDDYGHGDTVTLTASAEPGSVFVGWSGASCSGTDPCDVEMTQAQAVEARFAAATQTLTVARDGSGSGVVTADVGAISCGSGCSGSYSYGTRVTLTATADAGSTFAGWSGACSGETTSSCTVGVDETNDVTATFALAPHLLTVSLAGDGAGDVYSAPGGIGCGSDCSEALAPLTIVELTAVAATDSSFAGWTGACSGTGSCFVTMDSARNVTATFDKTRHLLEVTRAGAGAALGTISATMVSGSATATIVSCGDDCSELVPHGSSVTLTASGGVGASFAGWSGGGCSGTGSCTLSIAAAANVTASFVVRTYAVDISRVGNASMGRVVSAPAGLDCGSACSGPFAYGTTVTLTAQPEADGTFAGWTSGPCSGTGACTFTVTKAESISADFRAITHPITMTRVGTGSGSIQTTTGVNVCVFSICTVMAEQGRSYTYVAAPSSSMVFAGWEGGVCSGTGTCVLTVTGPATLTARFNQPDQQLSLSKAGSGAGVVTSHPSGVDCGSNCISSYAYGTTVTLTASPDATSDFGGWSSDCSDISVGVCAVTLTAAHTIVATFVPKAYTLSVTTSGSGTVAKSGGSFIHGSLYCSAAAGSSTSCSATVRHGDAVTLSAITPEIGTFVGWGGACSGNGGCTLTIDGSASVSATFATRTHTVSVSATGGGLGQFTLIADNNANTMQRCTARSCSYSYSAGTVLNLSAAAKAGVTFSGWSGACSGTGTACSFTVMSDSVATATFDAAPNVVFVTSTTHSGNLGGVSGADAICQARAAAAGLAGTFVAYLTSGSTGAYQRVSGGAGWVRTDGRPVTSDHTSMLNGFMYHPIRLDEFGNDIGAQPVMTGGSGDGLDWSNDCNGWSSNSALESRYLGYSDAVGDDAFSSAAEMGCGGLARIYCFQSDRYAYVTAEPVETYRLAFRSSTTVAADAGLVAADALCQSDADAAGLSGSFRALLATDGASAASRFDSTGAPWARRDGTALASTASGLLSDAFWDSAVIETAAASQTSLFGYNIWTGAASLTTAGTAATTCNNWSSTAGTSTSGRLSRTRVVSLLTDATSSCSVARHVLCLEE